MNSGKPLTDLRRKRMKYAALRQTQNRRGAKEAAMSPQIEELHIPDGFVLQQRDVCHQRSDERPMLRDEHGRVRAVVESWRPELAN